MNNCAHGFTPWGTYLACEENWAGYFRRVAATDNPKRGAKELASFARYGVVGTGRELWATAVASDPDDTAFARWNTEKLGTSTDGSDDFRNVANTYEKLRRFLVGPVDCEITGITETPDGKTLFVNIQHPGEGTPNASIGNPSAYLSHWPDGGSSRPRSATIAIVRNDGGEVAGGSR